MKDGRLGPEEALELARSIDRLAELARRLREYAATRPLPPGGLTTEEVRELLEAARELKRAQASR